MARPASRPPMPNRRTPMSRIRKRRRRSAEAMTCIEARGLRKSFGTTVALDGVNLRVEEGRILGLIGPNGAGKTTALNAILGLIPYQGEIKVLGRDPWTARDQLMRDVCFISDVAVLPRWIKVSQALDYVAGVHPRFDRAKAEGFLAKTNISIGQKVRHLSKGMVTQLHLALVMAIDARLLVLDEPTLGLDILYRKQFYDSLLNDYYDRTRTIVVTTHQVEEIQPVLTDVMFIDRVRIVLACSMEEFEARYLEVMVRPEHLAAAGLIILTSFIVGAFYCLEALYGERRDRSILFWKSLPVSDLTTVLSKASIPLVVLPSIAIAVSLATQLVMLFLSTVVLSASGVGAAALWSRLPLFTMTLIMFYGVAVHVLWHAPLYAWLLLISGWARRTPLLWVVLPPMALGVFERITFHTSLVASLVSYRVIGAMRVAFVASEGHDIRRLAQLDPLRFLISPGLWIGLIAAAAFLAAAARLRRDREPI